MPRVESTDTPQPCHGIGSADCLLSGCRIKISQFAVYAKLATQTFQPGDALEFHDS